MPRLRPVFLEGGPAPVGFTFECPGCGIYHAFYVAQTYRSGKRHAVWSFNGDLERPTFSPSLLVRSGHYAPSHRPGDACWCTYNAERPDKPPVFTCDVCHSFIRDGRIQFLSDCTHSLAGQTVDLLEIEETP